MTRVFVALSVACYLFVSFGNVEAFVKSSCLAYLVQISETRPAYIGINEIRKIGRIVRSRSLNDEEKAARVYQIYVSARLQDLNDEERPAVLKSLRNIEARYKGSVLNGQVRGEAEPEMLARIPESLRHSILMYAMILHEFEHVIQKVKKNVEECRATAAVGFHDDDSLEFIPELPFRLAVRERYLWELGAMKAEWEYFNIFSGDMRARAIEKIQSDPNLAGTLDDIRMLMNAGMSVDDYLEAEHQAGRHNMKEVKQTIKKLRGRDGSLVLPAYLGVVSSGIVATVICLNVKRPPPGESSLLYNFCSTIFPFSNFE